MTAIERGTGRIVRTIAELREIADATRAAGGTVGFFGTNGNLHEGHLTIVRRMVRECDLTIIPLHENRVMPVPGLLEFDLPAGYERNSAADRAKAVEAGVDVIFMPERTEMYPSLPVRVKVTPDDDLAAPWENAEDPAYVQMAATAVTKYWNIFSPGRYYLGEKDWVPLTVLRKVRDDLSARVEIVACPVVRLEDGLCASSRNRKLSPEDRAAAPVLYAAIEEAVEMVRAGERRPEVIRQHLRTRIEAVTKVDYAEIVDAYTLRRGETLEGDLRILAGADFSGVHLFDNAGVTV